MILTASGGIALTRSNESAGEWLGVAPISVTPAESIAAVSTPSVGDQEQPDSKQDDPVEITLDDINGLLELEDRRLALFEGRLWERELIVQETPQGDPRLVRLQEVIELLFETLSPPAAGPPPEIEQFRDLVNKLRDLLAEERLADARRAAEEADEMLQTHHAALAPQSRRFARLKSRLEELEGRSGGIRQIDALLEAARRSAETGNPVEAMVQRAQALNLARSATWITPEEEERLREQVDELRDAIRLARGRQALEDARKCDEVGDGVARDAEIALARSVLPGLPEETIAPLIDELEELADRSTRSVESPIRHELAARHAYEAALEEFGRGKFEQFVSQCLEVHALQTEHSLSTSFNDSITELIFTALEREAIRLASSEGDVAAVTSNRLQQLVEAIADLRVLRMQLARLTPWQADPRWAAIDSTAATTLEEIDYRQQQAAMRLAEDGQLQPAIDVLLPVADSGSGESGMRSAELVDEWRRELELRESQAAQDELWAEAERQVADEQWIEAARQLSIFVERYPDSSRRTDVDALLLQIAEPLEREIGETLSAAKVAADNDNLGELKSLIAVLQGVPVPPELQGQFAESLRRRDEIAAEVEAYLRQIRSASSMATPEQIILVLDLAAKILRLDPEQSEAQRLLDRSHDVASATAKELLRKAELFAKDSRVRARARRYLEMVEQLDPEGESGAKARQLLQDL